VKEEDIDDELGALGPNEMVQIVNLPQPMNTEEEDVGFKIPKTRQPYACKTCNKKFRTQGILNHHEMTHCYVQMTELDSRSIQPFLGDLVQNTAEVNNDMGFTENEDCTTSGGFSSQAPSAEHKSKRKLKKGINRGVKRNILTKEKPVPNKVRAKKNVGPFSCSVCDRRFARERYVADHLRLCHRDSGGHSCAFCGKQFTSKYFLIQHKKKLHSEDFAAEMEATIKTPREFKCTICNDEKLYKTKSSLRKHEAEAHDLQPHAASCEECKLTFKSDSNLRDHCQSVHLKIKPWLCPESECGMSFTKKYHLNRHLDLHSENKKYTCHICQKSFQQITGLQAHVKRHFGSEMEIQCTHCGQFYAGAQTLKKHVKHVHEGVRPYPCPKCSKSFKSTPALKYHIKTHDNPNGRKRGLNKERVYVPKRPPPHKLQVLPSTKYLSVENSGLQNISMDVGTQEKKVTSCVSEAETVVTPAPENSTTTTGSGISDSAGFASLSSMEDADVEEADCSSYYPTWVL